MAYRKVFSVSDVVFVWRAIMRFNQIPSIAADYYSTSRAIARDIDCNAIAVFARMMACKLRYGLDNSQYAYYNLHKKSLSECAEYLTKNELDRFQLAVNRTHTDLMDDKLAFFEKCLERGLPTPPILGLIDLHGVLSTGNKTIPLIKNRDALHHFLLKQDRRRLMLKRTTGSYGLGMLSVTAREGTGYDHKGQERSVDWILEHCRAWPEAFMIQDHLAVHESLAPLMPGCALGTFRVVTYLNASNTVDIPYAFVKIPLAGAINDNFHQGTTGNLLCGIDMCKGTLTEAWGKNGREAVISPILCHPDTGVAFRDWRIPFWSEILEMATKAAQSFKELRTVGWDIAVTQSGVFVLEGNWHYDPDGHQLTLNRGIRTEISRLFSH